MRLLLDNNLSPRLVQRLEDIFPETNHVALLGLDQATDTVVWDTAQEQGYTLISKDSDFNDLLMAKGFPPKVIWLRIGNCTNLSLIGTRIHCAPMFAMLVVGCVDARFTGVEITPGPMFDDHKRHQQTERKYRQKSEFDQRIALYLFVIHKWQIIRVEVLFFNS